MTLANAAGISVLTAEIIVIYPNSQALYFTLNLGHATQHLRHPQTNRPLGQRAIRVS
jgi:hypothetical protein